jgi:radical SAM superfamily enzyme YgiQ (UPF0313 family)
MRVALVNPNRILPPISPLGLEYVGEGLLAAGHEVNILDLCWEEQPERAIPAFFRGREYGLVGISIRNTDDCSFATRESFLPGFSRIVETIRNHSGAPIVAGGVGFSVMPEAVMAITGVDAGVVGDGELTLTGIADRCQRQASWEDLPNLVLHRNGIFRRTPVSTVPLSRIPPMSRTLVDNRRYYLEGGQAGVETKRGCPMGCVYCADPLAKGRTSRMRPPGDVVAELAQLMGQGIEHVHFCDSEFNVPEDHALEICGEIIRRGLGDRLHWYAYCKPGPFSRELAGQMRRSGCRGINFGADSGDEGMLSRLGRDFGPAEILSAARSCRENGIAVMLDLLLGAPGETRESIARTVERMMESGADRIGVTVGVRVYPGTRLAKEIQREDLRKGLVGGSDLRHPVFFLEPAIAPTVFDQLDALVGNDPRFLFFDPDRPDRNYNYNANQVLVRAIREGHRGAYWDILRRVHDKPSVPPVNGVESGSAGT